MAPTVYLGTSEFAATVLARIAGSAHRPSLVLTRPDRPSGRGRKLAAPPVAQAARQLGLALLQPDSVNDEATRAAIAAQAPTAICVCAFGALIKEPLLSAHPMLNVHPSLLPRWRGAAPVERSIMAGDTETGVSIMRLTAGLDSGPVCLQESLPIGPQDSYGTLAPRLAELGGELLVRALDDAPAFTPKPMTLASPTRRRSPPRTARLTPRGRPTHWSGWSGRSRRTSAPGWSSPTEPCSGSEPSGSSPPRPPRSRRER